MATTNSGSERDWPHDPDGEEGSEGMRKYGLAVLAKKVDEDAFPLRTDDFLADHGDEPVRINHRRVVSVADVVEHVEGEEFETKVAFNHAFGQAMRRGGFWDFHPGRE